MLDHTLAVSRVILTHYEEICVLAEMAWEGGLVSVSLLPEPGVFANVFKVFGRT